MSLPLSLSRQLLMASVLKLLDTRLMATKLVLLVLSPRTILPRFPLVSAFPSRKFSLCFT